MAILGKQLDEGATLPTTTWNLLDGSTVDLAALKDRWNVVLLLRGDW